MRMILLIGLAGAMGAVTRYLLSSFVTGLFGAAFPWGTFLVNAAGCFLFGVAVGLADHFELVSDTARLILLTGFMGAFTTFSTFIFDIHILFAESRWMPGLFNMTGQIMIGLICLRVGQKLVDVLN